MGIPLTSCSCSIIGELLFFMSFDFELLSWSISGTVFSCFYSDYISTCYCGDVVRTLLSLTDYSPDGD